MNSDLLCYQNQFYAVNTLGEIIIHRINIDRDGVDIKQVADLSCERLTNKCARKVYLVELDGKLLVISRQGLSVQSDFTYGTNGFQIFEVNLMRNKWTEIKDLGDKAVFVGDNSSFSVTVGDSNSILKRNSIYFTDCAEFRYDPTEVGKDIGIYHLGDRTIQPFIQLDSELIDPVSPHIWVEQRVVVV